ncbi:unnamed protein product [marine sediment metagenome]|uniref:Uncharacterized protein n=1 Tax=marine sediment metagenome TaxID=412755 RepID=X1HLD4_9ZZZZ
MLPTSICLEGLLFIVIFIKNIIEDFNEIIDKYFKTNDLGKLYVDDKELTIEGVGYNINGNILKSDKSIVNNDDLKIFLEVCMFCNNSHVSLADQKSGDLTVVGDPTEISMKVVALKENIDQSFNKIDEIPFNSDRKMMTVIGKKDRKIIAYIKGAPDILMMNASKVLLNGEVKPINILRDKILKQICLYLLLLH